MSVVIGRFFGHIYNEIGGDITGISPPIGLLVAISTS